LETQYEWECSRGADQAGLSQDRWLERDIAVERRPDGVIILKSRIR